jgi:ribosomal protein S18 acetylase RimI-like enzyme
MAHMKADTAPGVSRGCEVLAWDTEFFGRRIARVDAVTLATAGTQAVDEWCAGQGIECAYLLVDAGDQLTSDMAQSGGFKLVDVRLTLEWTGAPIARRPIDDCTAKVRLARREDMPGLISIARTCHRSTRFYADGNFDRERCDDFYERWIQKSCDGDADCVFVATEDDVAIGYLSCHLASCEGRIGLVGVHPGRRRRGAGRAMVREALGWFPARGVERVSVVTQGRNAEGLRLYQHEGMVVQKVEFWFHKWF